MILAIQILHVLVSVFLVLVILLQAGKGAGMGAAFGGAGSQTVFGGRGAQTFFGKLTAVAAGVFFLTSLTLSYASSEGGRSVLEGEAIEAPSMQPAVPPDTEALPATPPRPVAPPPGGEATPDVDVPTPVPNPTAPAPAPAQ